MSRHENVGRSDGFYQVEWNSRNAAQQRVTSGVYFYHLAIQEGNKTVFTRTKKMLLSEVSQDSEICRLLSASASITALTPDEHLPVPSSDRTDHDTLSSS
ncbi:MAG: hypothetical protein HY710_02705 [Candidatus Latescibacteria bacterium]|nr:hypothetical protein [Candidatus Latescibacterota bacterium]